MDRLERNMEEMGQKHRDLMGEIEALHVNIESLHDGASELHASMSELRVSVSELRVSVSELRVISQQDGENIRALARIAELHESRLTDLEGGSA